MKKEKKKGRENGCMLEAGLVYLYGEFSILHNVCFYVIPRYVVDVSCLRLQMEYPCFCLQNG